MVVDVIDATRPRMEENGRDNAIALEPILPTCWDEYQKQNEAADRWCTMRCREKFVGRSTYQKLLQKTEVSKHADNHESRDILPDPVKIHTNFQHFNLSNRQRTKSSKKKSTSSLKSHFQRIEISCNWNHLIFLYDDILPFFSLMSCQI